MGAKRRRLQTFLKQHPSCCFCGGETPATTQDHLPPRGTFFEKKWPEGYVFPACEGCNHGSSTDDTLIAFFSRWNPGREPTEAEHAEWRRLLAAFRERFPRESAELLLTANEKRRWMKEHGLEKPNDMPYAQVPLLYIPPLVRDAVERFNRKLAKALHYMHTRKIVPANAGMFVRWWTNAHVAANQFPWDITSFAPSTARIIRGNVALTDQFEYRYSVSEDGELGLYLSVFRSTFCLGALISFDAAVLSDEENGPDANDSMPPDLDNNPKIAWNEGGQ